ncbi:TIGR02646 family protein [Vibrio sp. 070316B]|uniref:retron system putative HNH endonuclease n=1 Tax=Vibrio sp. 070316B TaxID=2607608 RepID=UPI001493B58C|nr:retron system putative HNH endonuclease [Vibrio sp. 070316B]NOI41338.1 TIGR02646 family protein [Vibrio sp. 070316B]
MRTIKKISPCHALAERNKRPPTNHIKATKAWTRFRRHKPSVTRTCYQEQFGLCCYSEISLDNVFSIRGLDNAELSRALGTHIEHIEPKFRNPRKTFEYTNLILSAIDDPSKRNLLKVDVFGGHAKQRMYHATSFISPLLNNCSQYFHYEISGRVVPKASLPTQREKAKARLTIYILNLNSPILVEWRKVWLTELSKIIDESSIQALEHIAEAELGPTNNLLRPFHSAQKQMFGSIGTRVCAKYNL